MSEKTGDITLLLHQWRSGSRTAENELFALVLPNLRRLAHYLMKGERKGHSLQATELVDQIYMRLVAAKDRDWRSRQHFFAISARAMRRYQLFHTLQRNELPVRASAGMINQIMAHGSGGDSEKMVPAPTIPIFGSDQAHINLV